MSPELPKLPLGESDFPRLRETGCVYVDKTHQIQQMATSGVYFFLSRPRRFGKSLTVSTLQCLFEARRELFGGLWIDEKSRWDWKPHSVIVLDFNEISSLEPGELRQSLLYRLDSLAADHGLELNGATPNAKLGDLIKGLAAKSGEKVVVLIDEYDKPLIDHLGKGEAGLKQAAKNRDELKSMFGVLKGQTVGGCLRLLFVTGVSRFSRISIFSELNNLTDLSMDRRYATLAGWTTDELRSYFRGHLNSLAKKLHLTPECTFNRLTELYNGYRFTSANLQVFNPFCLAQAFYHGEFADYWFGSGSPSFLVRLIKERGFPPLELEGLAAASSEFDNFDLEDLRLKGLLFQTGYLTIRDFHDGEFTLGFPNQEVRSGFYKRLLFAGDDFSLESNQAAKANKLRKSLSEQNLEGFIKTTSSLFASVPYQQSAKLSETHFHALFYMMLAVSGMQVNCELLTSKGRIDVAVEFPDKVYVIELKCGQSAADALQQIADRGYLERYAGCGMKRIALGIEFNAGERNISEWKSEIYPD